MRGEGEDAEEAKGSGSTSEETRFVTQIVTVAEPAPPKTVEEPTAPENESPEDVLALQYEYINGGDFGNAYSLFDEQSRREVSPAQYRAFFEDNAPYSVTNYSFSPARVQDDSASVDAEFTVTSALGVEWLERTQEFVREGGEWKVVMPSFP
jgi:hypothetical protein